jgi:hypothetical protein
MRKGFAPPAIVFKGSGWAKKDRATGAGTKAARKSGESSDSASDAKSSDAKSSDSKTTQSGSGSGSPASAGTGAGTD